MLELLDLYDTSNFPENNQFNILKNVSVIGKFKDDVKGKIIWSFIGTGAKAYMVDVEGDCKKRAKGIQRSVVEKELTAEDYRNVVFNNESIIKKVRCFKSEKHQLYTELGNKVTLSFKDDKRYIIPDGSGFTLAWGHYNIPTTTTTIITPPPLKRVKYN